MRSYQIVEFGSPLQETIRETPEPEGSEVLVRVSACGVCHSDIHLRQGYFDLGDGERINLSERGMKLPFTLGHEVVGEVAALGPDAGGVEVGERRLVFPWIGCGECETCAAGVENLCLAPRTVGTRRDGGYSDHVLVPHGRYLLDYAGIEEGFACISACSGVTAYSALSKTLPLSARDRLLLIGAGGVGLMGLTIARARTEAELIVADIDPVKRQAALEAGAAQAIDPAEDGALEALIERSGGGVAAAIDFVGAPASAGFGLGSLRRGGKLIVVGLYGGKLPLVLPLVPLRPIGIIGSYVGTLAEMNELLDLIRAGHVTPIPMASCPLSEANAALDDLEAGKVVGRMLLRP